MHKHYRRRTVFIVFQKTGAKQCSGLEGKISESELCAGTAAEVLYLLRSRSEGSGAKQCHGVEGSISKSELCTSTADKKILSSTVKAQVQSSYVVSKDR